MPTLWLWVSFNDNWFKPAKKILDKKERAIILSHLIFPFLEKGGHKQDFFAHEGETLLTTFFIYFFSLSKK